MLKKLLHASVYDFDQFMMQRGGLHFGGRYSALRAVERHLRGEDDYFYLYTVLVDCSDSVETFDCADSDGWECEHICTQSDVLEYTNKYEPDIVNSICCFDLSRISIVSKELLYFSKVQQELEDFEGCL